MIVELCQPDRQAVRVRIVLSCPLPVRIVCQRTGEIRLPSGVRGVGASSLTRPLEVRGATTVIGERRPQSNIERAPDFLIYSTVRLC
jgi:hypothetical protein